jgi:transcriptional regulator with XRE-family HTH domain
MELGLTQEETGERGRRRFVAYMRAVMGRHPRTRFAWSVLGSHLAPATISRYERGLTSGRWESALALALALELKDVELFCLEGAEAATLRRRWQDDMTPGGGTVRE